MAFRIFIYRLPQDDPRKNTAIKLTRFGFAQLVNGIKALPSGSIMLDPTVKTPLMPSDRAIAESRVYHSLTAPGKGLLIFIQGLSMPIH